MKEQFTTAKEREYAQNRRLADILLGSERFCGFFRRKGIFTEQQVIDAIIKCYDEKITETKARRKFQDVDHPKFSDQYDPSFDLRDLTFLRQDTLGMTPVKSTENKLYYKVYTYCRDPGIS